MSVLTAHQRKDPGHAGVFNMEHKAGSLSPSCDEPESVARVLLVDDSRLARMAAVRIIQELDGLSVLEARDGVEALDLLRSHAPAAVLTDLEMPGMGGLELVAEIRLNYPQTPVILMTAHGSEQVAIQALRAGATNYVPKASMVSDLPETLLRVLAISAMEKRKRQVKGCLESRESRFRIKNDPELIESLVELLVEDLSAIGTSDSASRMRVGVALHEALANAIFHGNLEVSSSLRQEDERVFYDLARQRRTLAPYCERWVEVHARVDRHGALFVIEDEGPGFDTSGLLKPIEEEDMIKIGGRGMLLIRAFMDEIQHNESGNRITLTKRFRA